MKTLLTRIMPCLDMRNGRVVKGVQFVNIRDAGDPVACARAYCEAGHCVASASGKSAGGKSAGRNDEC